MNSLSVLVIEDDTMVGILLGETLEAMGYDVCAIESTEADAVNTAARCRPDLMIVDVCLIEGNGISAVEAITRDGPVPHVFVNGDVGLANSGPQNFEPNSIVLRKPYREADLVGAIKRAFGAGPMHLPQPA
jgi:CheY-like chemotaxis protein